MQRYDAKNVKNGDNEKMEYFFLLPGFMRQLNLMADVVFFDRRTEGHNFLPPPPFGVLLLSTVWQEESLANAMKINKK